jgi:hypothetical protein
MSFMVRIAVRDSSGSVVVDVAITRTEPGETPTPTRHRIGRRFGAV